MSNTNGSDSAHPYQPVHPDGTPSAKPTQGLTKREYFAAMAMQGLCAGRTEHEHAGANLDLAVRAADELIKALNKEVGD